MANQKDIKLAKRLARLVMDAGESGVAELRPALERILEGRSNSDKRNFLKAFHKAATREVHKDTLIVESATPLDKAELDGLMAHFSKDHDRPLQLVIDSNPDLIAGLRVRLGDTVYDASLANNLQSLANRIH